MHVEGIGPHVSEGHYDLLGPQGEIILPHVWETVIEPDWTITMHMWPMTEEKEEATTGALADIVAVEEGVPPPPPPAPSAFRGATGNGAPQPFTVIQNYHTLTVRREREKEEVPAAPRVYVLDHWEEDQERGQDQEKVDDSCRMSQYPEELHCTDTEVGSSEWYDELLNIVYESHNHWMYELGGKPYSG